MHPQTMQSVVDSMLSQYKEYGIADASYSTYKTGYCAPVIRFCIERNSGMYSAAVLDSYLSAQKKNIAFVAGDFSEIPITDGIYTKILKTEESAW